MIEELRNLELLSIGDFVITLGSLLGFILLSSLAILFYTMIRKTYLGRFYKFFNVTEEERIEFKNIFRYLLILLTFWISFGTFKWDFVFFESGNFIISISLIVKVLLIYQIGQLLIWIVDNIIHNIYLGQHPASKEEIDYNTKDENSIIRTIRNAIYLIVIILIINISHINYKYATIAENGGFSISIVKILTAILIILFARLVVWFITRIILFSIYKNKEIEFAQRFAINKLILYVVYVISIFIALHFVFESKMTVILGGGAALLVGVGLGLQQTFNDFFSGLVLLFERSVGVSDIIEVENQIGKVLKIGLRSSLVQTRDMTTIVVPNSKMVNLNIQNISHEFDITRFEVKVSVAYGSDTALVKQLLISSLEDIGKVRKSPSPEVQFSNFGADGLEFRLLFYTRELFRVEKIKSDIRFKIDELFRANDITIPFPQMTVWMAGDK